MVFVLGHCFTNARTDCKLDRSLLQIAWLSSVLRFGTWDLILYLGFAGPTTFTPSHIIRVHLGNPRAQWSEALPR